MVNSNRIKSYTFSEQAFTGSNIEVYSSFPINGQIQRIEYFAGSYATNGSLWVMESGTNVFVHKYLNLGNGGANIYPRVFPVDPTNGAISGAGGIVVNSVCNNVLVCAGSGQKAGSYFGGVKVYFI